MNAPQNNQSSIPWGKIGIVIAAIVLVAVFSGRAGLEDLFNLEPGTLGGTAVAEKDDSQKGDNESPHKPDSTDGDSTPRNSQQNSSSGNNGQSQSNNSKEFQLTKKGFVLESPEGLTYYVGDRGENRIDHVMRHAQDQPNRPGSHGVFHGNRDEILATIDEAYALIKANSNRVLDREKEDSRIAYEIDMKRNIGFKGGQSGKRAGHPKLKILKLVLDKGNRVITAYPYR